MKEKDPFTIWLLILLLIFTVFKSFFVNGAQNPNRLYNSVLMQAEANSHVVIVSFDNPTETFKILTK